jgi:hypothetical protein
MKWSPQKLICFVNVRGVQNPIKIPLDRLIEGIYNPAKPGGIMKSSFKNPFSEGSEIWKLLLYSLKCKMNKDLLI